MSNSRTNKRNARNKNNNISSILGLNNLRNSARKMSNNISNGLKSARNSIMPEFVPGTTKQNNNNRASLGDLLMGNDSESNNSGDFNNFNIYNNSDNISIGENVKANVENISKSIKNNSMAMNASVFSMGFGWFKYFLLFMILLFLGINVFSYLAKTSAYFADLSESILKPIAEFFGFSLTKTAKKVVDTSAEGAKYGIDITKNVLDEVLTFDENGNKIQSQDDKQGNKVDGSFIGELERDITPNGNGIGNGNDDELEPEAAESGHKKGSYCLVGVDRGYRSCVKLSDGDKCMSGKVFPSREMCVNPNSF